MTTGQKIIKGLGIALAIFIIVSIISGVFVGITAFIEVFDLSNQKTDTVTDKNLIVQDNYDIQSLEIELSYTKLIIKEGSELKAETNNNDIKIQSDNHKLVIEEKSSNFFKNYKDYELIVYLPNDKTFNSVEIKAGAGKVMIDALKSYDLDFEFGAGSASLSNLVVLREARIEGGAGAITIDSGSLNNLDLEMGVGKFTLLSTITGHSKIKAGIGEVDLTLLGEKDDYKFTVKKGLGPIILDGLSLQDDESYGMGYNLIELDGGIGKIAIDFK